MKLSTFSAIFFALALFAGQAFSRQCFAPITSAQPSSSKEIEIQIASEDHPQFKELTKKCQYYWKYYSGNVKKTDGTELTQDECNSNPSLIDLSQGYAPLGVFFRMASSRPTTDILGYEWKISGPGKSKTVLAKYDSFNAAYVFEKPGIYRATLKVTYNDGAFAQDEKTVTVWPRKGSTYYVDAVKGDDRYDGKSKVAESKKKCDPESGPIGTCKGPWKTATRAFGVLSPRDWSNNPSSKYTANSVCSSTSIKQVTEYADGNFSLYKGQSVSTSDALKDDSGAPKSQDVEVCASLNAKISTSVQSGDQVLFKKGQTFELEPGVFVTSTFNRTVDGQVLPFEQLSCNPLISPSHYSTPLGILFSAYGTGKKPKIINTGVGCTLFDFPVVGVFHLAFQDLDFNLENSNGSSMAKRSNFMFAVGNMMNLVMNRISLEKFRQGVQFHNAHGVFLKNNLFYDSEVVHLYSETASDVAILKNKFDYSANHLSYTNMSNSLIVGNRFSRQAFGRTALRIYGSDPVSFVTENVWVSDNLFAGWIDPRTTADCTAGTHGCQYADGKRYNFDLVELQPNDSTPDHFSANVVFKRNILMNAENLLAITGYSNLLVEDNIFDTLDTSATPRIKLHHNYGRRPLSDIRIHNNLIIERAAGTERTPSISEIDLKQYEQIACDDLVNHNGIYFWDNVISLSETNCIASKTVTSANTVSCILDKTQLNADTVTTPEMSLIGNSIISAPTSSQLKKLISVKTKKWTGPKK